MWDGVAQINKEMATVIEKVQQSLVQIRNGPRGAGAGTIWHPHGLIVTNAHVVQNVAPTVVLPDGRALPARVLAHDQRLDLAAISVRAMDLPTIALGNAKRLHPGDWVVALGHPWGVPGAAAAGIVIDVGVPLEMADLGRELIQVSLRVRPGNSGGPLVDVAGRLVGVNTMMAGPGVGLAIPIHVVKAFLRRTLV